MCWFWLLIIFMGLFLLFKPLPLCFLLPALSALGPSLTFRALSFFHFCCELRASEINSQLRRKTANIPESHKPNTPFARWIIYCSLWLTFWLLRLFELQPPRSAAYHWTQKTHTVSLLGWAWIYSSGKHWTILMFLVMFTHLNTQTIFVMLHQYIWRCE